MGRACVRQQDGSDCGAAALATVMKHYRRPVSLQALRGLTGTDRVGTDMLGLVEAGERLGFDARGVRGPYEMLEDVPLPAIAHVTRPGGEGHFVVLHEVGAKRLVVADPAEGLVQWTPEEFRARWTGHLLLLVPTSSGPALEAPRTAIGRLRGLLSDHVGSLAIAAACALLMTLAGLASSYGAQRVIDALGPARPERGVDVVALGLLLLVLFRVAFGCLRQVVLSRMSHTLDQGLLRGYFRHILRLPISFFESRRMGEILSRANDAGRIRQAVSGTTISILLDVVLMIGAGTVLIAHSPKLAAVVLLYVPIFLVAVGLHLPALKGGRRRMMEEGAGLQAATAEIVAGAATIKALSIERSREAGTEGVIRRYMKEIFRGELLLTSLGAAGTLLGGLASVFILWFGGHAVLGHEMSVGQLMFVLTLFGFIAGPVERLATLPIQVHDALIALERMGEVLDLPVESSGHRIFEGLRQGFRLEGVSFRYAHRRNILESIDLEIPRGKRIAIVGESGSGKSTLCKILAAFHRPTEGRVLVDGVDIGEYDLASFRGRIGWVEQDPFVFGGTIRENIAMARPGAMFEDVREAARLARLDDLIESLPDRYDTKIGERGANLSGGERQRLAIARAVLRRPDLLLFDEATSHLDTRTERAIQESFEGVLARTTSVVVAHRLSTIRDADLIVVLERGRIVERGAHEELLRRGGVYARLWAEQQTSGAAASSLEEAIPLSMGVGGIGAPA